MGRKNKPDFDNSLFRILLKNYQENETNRILEKKIDYIVDDFYRNKKSSRFNLFSLIPVSAFALIVCVIFSVFMISHVKEVNTLNNNIIITEKNDAKTDVKIVSYNSTINTMNNKRVKIQTNEVLMLIDKNTVIEIKSGKKIFGGNQKKIKNKYILKKGKIFAEVSGKRSAGDFTIETSYGKIKASAAKFIVKIDSDKLIVKCYKGNLEFISTQKNAKTVRIKENFQIIIKEKDEKFEIKEITIESEKEEFPELKRDLHGGKFEEKDNVKYIDIEVSNNEAGIYINNIFLDKGKARYICKNKERINIMIKLEGYREINDNLTVTESKKISYSLIKLYDENTDAEIKEKKEVLNKIWESNIYYLSEIIFFDNYISVISENSILILNDKNGSTVKTVIKKKTQSGFTSYNNLMLFHEAPDKIKVVKIPAYKSVFESKAGPIAFGKPFIDKSNIILASTNHSFYVFNYLNNSIADIVTLDSGFYCTPVKKGDKIILSNLSKKIIVYSLNKKSILWEKIHENRFTTEQPVVNYNNNFFAVTDEKSKTYIYNIENGDLKFTVNSDKLITPQFAGNNLFISNNNKLKKYDITGKLINEINLKNNFLGFMTYKNNLVYIINKNSIGIYDNNLIKKDDITVDDIIMFEYNGDNFYLLHNNNKLVKYKIQEK